MSKTLDEFVSRLKDAEGAARSLGIQAMSLTLNALQKVVEVYPPQPDRMRSGRFNTYVRGVGHYPLSSFIPDKDTPGGYKVKRTRKSKIRMTSEQMNKRFVQTVTTNNVHVLGTLKNEASYSGWVLGTEDQGEVPHQVPWHAETGWVSEETGTSQIEQTLEHNVAKMTEDFIKGL